MGLPLKYSVRNVFARPASTLLTALAIALWAFLFIFLSGFVEGIREALVSTGSADNVLVLRQGASSETNSGVTREQAQVLSTLTQVARGKADTPLLVSEAMVLINLPKVGSQYGANVGIRGVEPLSFDPQMGRHVKIMQGRMFQPMSGELVVSRNVSGRYQNCTLGSTLHFEHRDWKVVGVFDAGGTAFDSEIWGDREDVLQQFKRNAFSSVTFRLASPGGLKEVVALIAGDQRLQLEARTERSYYEAQQRGMEWIKFIFYALAVVFSVSMFFAASNAIYSAVQGRTREIGTLRAIGFSGGAVMQVFLLEALVLGILGGLLGSIPASLLVPRMSTGITNFGSSTFSDTSFHFHVSPQLFGTSLLLCCLISVVGGFLPSLRASSMQITRVLREQ